MATITVKAVAPTPTLYSHCAHCETMFGQVGVGQGARRQMLDEYPAEMVADYNSLCETLRDLSGQFGRQVHFEIVDPQSLEGVWLALRHRIGKYPTFIIGGRQKVVGWEKQDLQAAIAYCLEGGC
jgi:hypothetical protein